MNKKCIGCGSVLQYENEHYEGYVKKEIYEKADLCERCFKIKHYGKMDIIDISFDYDKMLKEIQNKNKIYIIDLLNISDEIKKYMKYMNENDIILLNKKDLFPKSIRDKKLIMYFKKYYPTTSSIYVIGSKNKYNIDKLFYNLNKNEYYVIGLTNSGKSTFINALISHTQNIPKITTSYMPNTTTEYIKIKLNDNLTLIDTPGFINEKSIYKYLTVDKVKYITPKSRIKPRVMQTKKDFTCIVEDILRIDNIGNKTSLVFYISNSLNVEKMKIKTRDTLISLPKKIIEFNGEEDIVIDGLGFINVTKPTKLVIYCLDESLISVRPKML